MPGGWSSARGRILQDAWLGVLTYVIPPGLVDEAVGDGPARETRLRSLPARVTAYFVLGLCLFSADPYPAVIGKVTAGLADALAGAGWARPASTALSAARRRLGEAPLEAVFRRLCGALSPGAARWSHACGLLLTAWDGTTLATADTPANAAAFGRAGSTAGPAGPHLRAVTLMACGTRCLLDAALGPLTGKGNGERALARRLLPALRPGMLLLADRNFWSFRLWNDAAASGAHLLWRVRGNKHARVVRDLPDGSRLARVEDPVQVSLRLHKNAKRARKGKLPPDTSPLPGAVTVRVIEFLLAVTADDGTVRTEPYRLFTTLTDHRAYPARELAAAYARR
jgi:transposase IS4-like protein